MVPPKKEMEESEEEDLFSDEDDSSDEDEDQDEDQDEDEDEDEEWEDSSEEDSETEDLEDEEDSADENETEWTDEDLEDDLEDEGDEPSDNEETNLEEVVHDSEEFSPSSEGSQPASLLTEADSAAALSGIAAAGAGSEAIVKSSLLGSHGTSEAVALRLPEEGPAPAAPAPCSAQKILGLKTAVDFDIGQVRVSLAQIQSWNVGSIVELDPPQLAGGMEVILRVNGDKIGTGELVVIDDRVAVRIVHLFFQKESE